VNRFAAYKERVVAFLFPIGTDTWLTILRVGLGLQVTLYALSLRNDWNYLLAGRGGLVNRNLAEGLLSLESHFVPRLGWLVAVAEHIGLSEQIVLSMAWTGLFSAGCALLIGFGCRFFAVLAWLLHLCAAKSGTFLAYGVDVFMTTSLFYLVLAPLPDRFSFDWQLRGVRPRNPQLLGFWRRVLQLHLCVIYFFSGLTKCLGKGWWDGSSVWRALIRPPFNVIDPELLVRLKYLLPVAGIVTLALEISFPFFIWNSRTRNIWLISICVLHAAIGLTMGMYLFALVMIILNLAAFAPELAYSQQPRLGSIVTTPNHEKC
jgi:hypothetical protein